MKISGKKLTISILVFVVLVSGWLIFRPELLFIDHTVNEETPMIDPGMPSETALLYEGKFHSIAHQTIGTAKIYQYPNGKQILHLADFETSNGPDVHIYLVAAQNVPDDATVKNSEFIDLGLMKGNIGNQNYDLPENVDLTKYRSVTIWCRRFGVNFGTAHLDIPNS